MRWPKLRLRAVHAPQAPAQDAPALAPALAPVPAAAKAPEPVLIYAARCPCCGLSAARSPLEPAVCSGDCERCGGPCLGFPQRTPSHAAPPLLRRPVEDFNWQMRN